MRLLLRDVRLPLADFDLEIGELEIGGGADGASTEGRPWITALFGPSGAGKTSLLDLIAGLRRPRSAYLALDGEVLADTARGILLPARRRRIGYVPQDLALFPHLGVRGNLLYGRPKEARGGGLFSLAHVAEVLEVAALLGRGVGDLSGGERQRVALARALLSAPRLLLLDEPLAALDRRLKAQVVPYLHRVRDELGVPMLYVSHDEEEVRALAGDVLLLDRGRVVGRGAPARVLADGPPLL